MTESILVAKNLNFRGEFSKYIKLRFDVTVVPHVELVFANSVKSLNLIFKLVRSDILSIGEFNSW